MLKQLKFDCYKIFHSRTMRIVLYVCLLLSLVYPIAKFTTNGTNSFYTLMAEMTSGIFSQQLLNLAAVLFIVFLLGMDFNSGYIKNIYTSTNRVAYIFSKIICLFVFIFVFQVLYFLFGLFGSAVADYPIYLKPGSGSNAFYELGDSVYIKFVHFNLFAQGCVAFAFAMAIMFLLFVTKNQWAALVVGLIYVFLGEYVHLLIDTVINKVSRSEVEFHIDRYLILQYDYFLKELSGTYNIIRWKGALLFIGMTTFYTLLAIGCSFLVFMKRKVKC
ncbi:MAG: ABC transporter permease subunit [Clostridia bacterium]|nr:ABC transporter permease subunit [Clostridia bacterium]